MKKIPAEKLRLIALYYFSDEEIALAQKADNPIWYLIHQANSSHRCMCSPKEIVQGSGIYMLKTGQSKIFAHGETNGHLDFDNYLLSFSFHALASAALSTVSQLELC